MAPETTIRSEALIFEHLDQCLGQEEAAVSILDAAIWLAALDRPAGTSLHVPLAQAQALRTESARLAAQSDNVVDKMGAILDFLAYTEEFRGDSETYDAPENADMIHVLERKKGLPVALAIIAIDCLRAGGLPAYGLTFPAHFLLRVHCVYTQTIIDAFDYFLQKTPQQLRYLAKKVLNPEAELKPSYFEAISDRTTLFRLLNNTKLRVIKRNQFERSSELLLRMRHLMPDYIPVIHEHALIYARMGNFDAAIDCVEQCLNMTDETTSEDQLETLKLLLRRYTSERDLQQTSGD